MRRLLSRGATLMAALFATLALPATAAEPAKAWEADGFKQPESVLWDQARKVLYVSNVNGNPPEKDGNGFIALLSPDGKVLNPSWATGLDAPKGMALVKNRLYVSDIDRLVEIDTATGKVAQSWAAPGARFLNDVAADGKGDVYVSDMLGDAIWRLSGGTLEKWLADPRLEAPNGLKVSRGRLMVAAWGPMSGQGFATTSLGMLKAVSLKDKSIRDLTPRFGNLDGLEPDGEGGWLVSDWMNGGVFNVLRDGHPIKILTLGPGSADIGLIPRTRLLLVPLMKDGKVAAYRLP